MKYLILFLLFLNSVCYAQQDQVVVDAGLGVFNSKGSSLSQDKFAKIGYQEEMWYNLKNRINVGGWIDTRGNGYSSSAFTGDQLGFEVSNDVFDMSIWSGPTVISSPDQLLGGMFQMNETIYFGIKDKDDNSVGIAYNHFSSGGIETPNIGRDVMGLELKFPLY